MAQNLQLSDKVLIMEQELSQLKIEQQTGFINEPVTPMKHDEEFDAIDFNPSPAFVNLQTPNDDAQFSEFDFGEE